MTVVFARMQLLSVESSEENDTVLLNMASYMWTWGGLWSAVMGATDGLISSAPTLKEESSRVLLLR